MDGHRPNEHSPPAGGGNRHTTTLSEWELTVLGDLTSR
jgi:hypothetical protein